MFNSFFEPPRADEIGTARKYLFCIYAFDNHSFYAKRFKAVNEFSINLLEMYGSDDLSGRNAPPSFK